MILIIMDILGISGKKNFKKTTINSVGGEQSFPPTFTGGSDLWRVLARIIHEQTGFCRKWICGMEFELFLPSCDHPKI